MNLVLARAVEDGRALKKTEILEAAKALRREARVGKQIRRGARERQLAAATQRASQKLGSKLYGVIYADPPWDLVPWSRETGMDRSAANHSSVAVQTIERRLRGEHDPAR